MLLPFIIIGVVSGAVYGLAAVGLVLSYRTSGIFNFAHGALATLSAYLFYELHDTAHVAWPIARTHRAGGRRPRAPRASARAGVPESRRARGPRRGR